MSKGKQRRVEARAAGGELLPPGPPVLTAREHEVLTMLAHGATGTEIAEALVISSETVRSRTRSARERLGAKTRIHAVALAVHRGEIEM